VTFTAQNTPSSGHDNKAHSDNPYRRRRIERFESGTGQHDGTISINSCLNSGNNLTVGQHVDEK
jgi:hypothetical protein